MLGSATRLAQTTEALIASAVRRPSVERGRCLVGEVFDELAFACEPLAASRAVSVLIDPGDDGLAVGAEREITVDLLHPIVENACRHARSRVCLSAALIDGSCVELVVDDDGGGVPEADLERIFEPGERGTSETDLRHDGAGLGLALARRLARSVGGEVSAKPGTEGARFVVRLPVG